MSRFGRLAFLGGEDVDCGTSAEKTFCGVLPPASSEEVGGRTAPRPVALGAAGDTVKLSGFSGLISPHRMKLVVHIHFLYSRWQSAHPMSGEYQSRPHAKVVSVAVKLVRYERRGVVSASGMLDALYAREPSGGEGSGTE